MSNEFGFTNDQEELNAAVAWREAAMIDDTITRDPNLKESGGYISWITNNGHLYAS